MAELGISDLRPGNRVTLYRLLGRGAWKLTVRGVHVPSMQDVAIKVYLKRPEELKQVIDELSPLLVARDDYTTGKEPFAVNICQIVDYFDGDDGRLYWAEELIERPLDKMGRIESGELFSRIARDLSRGLAYLHRKHRMHGDVKLENVGLTHGNVAKIFDLGSVTSKPDAGNLGNFATRDPAIIAGMAKYQYASDIWALGATLFALRTGEYPFIYNSELKRRNKLKKEVDEGKTLPEKKTLFDQTILGTVRERLNESRLRARVLESLPGRPGEILSGMLHFDQTVRPNAADLAEQWDDCLAAYLLGPSPTKGVGQWSETEEIKTVLSAFIEQTIAITDSQWTHIQELISEVERSEGAEHQHSPSPSLVTLQNLYGKAQSRRLMRPIAVGARKTNSDLKLKAQA
jgi:serine/threonine protein kinase